MKQRNSLLVICAGLAVSNVLLGVGLVNSRETVIVVPPEIKRSFSFTASSPSESYLEEMSLFYASLVLDNSEMSFPYKRDLILRYVAPQHYGEIKRQLLGAQERYKKEGLSTHFRPLEVKVNAEALHASVTGELVSFVGGTRVSSSKETYFINYAFEKGFLNIISFTAGDSKVGEKSRKVFSFS